jgi:hypothetical protein
MFCTVASPFKLNPEWLKDDTFGNIVKQVWNDPRHLIIDGAQKRLVKKLSLLKLRIKEWAKEKRKKDQEDLSKIEEAIESVYTNISLGITTMEDSLKLSKLELKETDILLAEEESWRQKSRAIWIKSGDRNTKFFHLYASHRRNKKFIWEINDEKGNVHSGQQAIKEEAVRHFSSFYNDIDQSFMEERWNQLDYILPL